MINYTITISNIYGKDTKTHILNMAKIIAEKECPFVKEDYSNDYTSIYSSDSDRLIISDMNDIAILSINSAPLAFNFVQALGNNKLFISTIMSILKTGTEHKNLMEISLTCERYDIIPAAKKFCETIAREGITLNLAYNEITHNHGSLYASPETSSDQTNSDSEQFVTISVYSHGEEAE